MAPIIAIAQCPCGSPATIKEHPDGKHRWTVRCSRVLDASASLGKRGRPQTACRESETSYHNNRELAVARWNAQFCENLEPSDDSPRCHRCGLRLPCNECIGSVHDYARSGGPSGGEFLRR